MDTLSAWILTVILAVAPTDKLKTKKESEDQMKLRYEEIAQDMSVAIKKSKPLFNGPNAEQKTAALLTSIAFFESGFRKDVDNGKVRGDNGRSWCLMQLNIGNGHLSTGTPEVKSWTGLELVADRKKCFIAGLEVLRASMGRCSSLSDAGKISAYTSGKCAEDEKTSMHRWRFAQRIMSNHPWPTTTETKANK